MTLINVVYIPTGIVMSGDSRTSGHLLSADGGKIGDEFVISDATNKVFLLFDRIGVITAGRAHINNMPIEHYVKNFEIINLSSSEGITVQEVAEKLYDYIQAVSPKADIYFMIAGYDGATANIYEFNCQNADRKNALRNLNERGSLLFSAFYVGDTEVVKRLTNSPNQPLYVNMNIQDAIDYSRHLIRTTIDQLRFEPRFPTVGGEIDTLLIQPEGGTFIYKKKLTYRV